MKISQELESLFKLRLSSNENIIPYLVNLSKLGKIDEPKKVALFMIILDRLGKIEDEKESFEELIKSLIKEEVEKKSRKLKLIAH